MKTPKHSRAPWQYDAAAKMIRDADGKIIGAVGDLQGALLAEQDKEKADANGRLFAAAPELATALRRLLTVGGFTVADEARAVLAKLER